MRTSLRISAAPLLVAVMAANANGQATTTRDSAGIRIVENRSRLKAPVAFRITDMPSLDLGGTADTRFHPQFSPTLALRLSDGRVVVADNGYVVTPEPGDLRPPDRVQVKYFTPAGKLLQTVTLWSGTQGQFRRISGWCRMTGDTLLLSGLDGLGVLDPRGNLVRVVPGVPGGRGCLRDESILVTEGDRMGTGPYAPIRMVAINADGKRVHDFGMQPMMLRKVPAGDRMLVHDEWLAEYRLVADSGRLSVITRTDDQPTPIPQAVRDAYAARPRAEGVRYISDIYGQADKDPVFDDMLTDSTGRVWMQAFERDRIARTRGNTWTAFDSTGTVLGHLKLPPSSVTEQWEVISIGATEVIVAHRAKGEIHILFYPLLRMGRTVP